MAHRTLTMDDRLTNYLLSVSVRDTPVHKALREKTATLDMARMQIAPDQAQFMALLVKLIQAEYAIEVGTFTGYSALVVAEALPPHGQVIACDVSEEWTAIGRRYWRQAGVERKIDLRLAPARQTLDALVNEGGAGRFDFAFIDADKENQQHYFEYCLDLVRTGGLIAIDNTLWGGSVVDEADEQPSTVAIRLFNQSLMADSRVDISMVPIGDGLTLALKR